MNNLNLEGKVALVTGATGLLGKEHCKALHGAGAKIVICDLDKEKCLTFADQLGSNTLSLEMDITKKLSIQNGLDCVKDTFKKVDILINNAAINDMYENPLLALENSKFENYPLEMWTKMFEVNVTGMFLVSQIVGAFMAEKENGSIINISSTYGLVGPDQSIYKDKKGKQTFFKSPAYSSTKGAVISFTKYLAAYWGNKNVRVNCLSPGGVQNNQSSHFINCYSAKTPLGRMANSKDYHGAIVFLASDASSYMTGANLVIDGGWTCI